VGFDMSVIELNALIDIKEGDEILIDYRANGHE
jgi:hypothetical protein